MLQNKQLDGPVTVNEMIGFVFVMVVCLACLEVLVLLVWFGTVSPYCSPGLFGTCYVDQNDFDLVTLPLHLLPKGWNYLYALPCLCRHFYNSSSRFCKWLNISFVLSEVYSCFWTQEGAWSCWLCWSQWRTGLQQPLCRLSKYFLFLSLPRVLSGQWQSWVREHESSNYLLRLGTASHWAK